MGSITSKAFMDLVEDEDIPQTPVVGKKIIPFDPRSPTVGIMRTPIQVDKTPERLIDPRSPTAAFCRTPILNTDEDELALNNSGSAGRGRRHSFSGDSLTDIHPLSLQDSLNALPPLDLDMDEESPSEQQDEPVREDRVNLRRTSSTPELNACDSVVLLAKDKATNETPTVKFRKNKTKTKAALFQGNTNIIERDDIPRSPLRILSDTHQRSPLGRKKVDVNSPRIIVQRKQVNKLGMLKSMGNAPAKSANSSPCRLQALSKDDKENITM